MKVNVKESPEMYFCAVCNSSYRSVEERAECEAKCIKERREAEEKKKQLERNTAKIASEEAIHKALNDVNEMISDHVSKYESISLKGNYVYLKYIFKNNVGWWF